MVAGQGVAGSVDTVRILSRRSDIVVVALLSDLDHRHYPAHQH